MTERRNMASVGEAGSSVDVISLTSIPMLLLYIFLGGRSTEQDFKTETDIDQANDDAENTDNIGDDFEIYCHGSSKK